MKNEDRYIVYNSTTLYKLRNSNCTEGDSVTLNNTSVNRVYLVNGQWQESDIYTTSNYSNTVYTCHVWSSSLSPTYDPSALILPSTLIVLCFMYVIYKWFIRLRG